MSIKALILAAATVASTASIASANTYFDFGPRLSAGSTLDLGVITTAGAGVVEIYDYHTGEQGRLLGTQSLNAGANADVRVNTGIRTKRDVIAVVTIDGEVAATKVFDVTR